MFERVITQTIQRISSEVLRDRQSVPLTEILEDERIPSRFKPFFATEVRWWLYNDALARGANKRFDFANPEVASLLDYLEQVMFRHARFEHDEFVSTLDGAVKLTFNYLCRPQTTLKWYIFRGQPVKPLSEVMLRFESFLDYEYIGNVFAEWVERKVRERATFEAISATEFERIIRRIDDQILLSCTVDELVGLLDPIFDFIGEGDDQLVPLDALIIFFDDKNIARLVEHLERYRAPDIMVSRARFVGILEELLTSAEENPEADFSTVYQNDELDDIVRLHLEAEGRLAPAVADEPAVPAPNEGNASAPSSVPVVSEPAGFEPGVSVPADPVTVTSRPADPEPTEPEPTEPEPADPGPADPGPAGTEPAVSEPAESEPAVSEPAGSMPDRPRFDVPEAADANLGEQSLLEASATSDAPEQTSARGQQVAPATPLEDAPFAPEPHEQRSGGETRDDYGAATIDDVVSRLEETTASVAGVATEVATDLDVDVDTEPVPTPADAADRETRTHEHSGPRHTPMPAQAPPAVNAAAALDPMLERKVLKKLFNKDRPAFDDAMARLATAETWRQASQILDELFIRFDVDPYSRTALRFTDSIYTRYVPNSLH